MKHLDNYCYPGLQSCDHMQGSIPSEYVIRTRVPDIGFNICDAGMTKTIRGHLSITFLQVSVFTLLVSVNGSRTEAFITTHTNSVLEPFELILISYQTTTCPYEEMEAAVTDMLKMPYRSIQFKSLSAV